MKALPKVMVWLWGVTLIVAAIGYEIQRTKPNQGNAATIKSVKYDPNPFIHQKFKNFSYVPVDAGIPNQFEALLYLAKDDDRLYGSFTNKSNQMYKTAELVVYIYDRENAIVDKQWVHLDWVGPEEKKMRVDQRIGGKEATVEDAGAVLKASQSVIVVPGYGMAVSQAQHAVRDLATALERRRGRT